MPSPVRILDLGTACWRRWSERTCSWSRSTIADAGIATTISLPTCYARGCWTSSRRRCRNSTGGGGPGAGGTVRRPRPTPLPRAAGGFSKAADLIELSAPALRRSRQEAALLGWLAALPDELLRCRPVLSNVFAGELLGEGKLEDADARLRDAERWLGPPGADRTKAVAAGMMGVVEGQFRRLPGAIAVHRAGLALLLGHLALTEEHARRALDLTPEDDYLGRGGAAALR